MMTDDTTRIQTIPLSTPDCQNLSCTLFEPRFAAKATLVALPGIGVPARVFRHLGHFMAGRGVRLFSVDYRGMGASRTEGGIATASLTRWAQADIPAVMDYVTERGWGDPILLAHSFGGQAIGLTDALRNVSGAILVACQNGNPRNWRGWDRLKVELLWRALLPLTTPREGMTPRWIIGEALPAGVAREWMAWGRSRDWFFEHDLRANDRFAQFEPPELAYGVTDDVVAPPLSVTDILDRFRSAKVTRVEVTPADLGQKHTGHMGLLRPNGTGDIWNHWLAFALEHGAHGAPRAIRSSSPTSTLAAHGVDSPGPT